MRGFLFITILVFALKVAAASQEEGDQGVLYHEDFEAVEVGKVPDDFLVLDGDFAVEAREEGKVLALPGAPLATMSFLCGPTRFENITIGAKAHASRRGRRYPSFAVGLGGVRGYKLRVSPAKDKLELVKGRNIIESIDYQWKSDTWTQLRLRIRKPAEDKWVVEAKAWPDTAEEPNAWSLKLELEKKPTPGRPIVSGTPYSGKPVLFDDVKLQVTDASAK